MPVKTAEETVSDRGGKRKIMKSCQMGLKTVVQKKAKGGTSVGRTNGKRVEGRGSCWAGGNDE